jgi:LPXTG-motif cell wall-anchored protein
LFLGTLWVGATLSTAANNPLYFAVGAGALVVVIGLFLLRTRK